MVRQNEEELMSMIADHYLGESQLLTSGAEDSLLKLAELRGNMTAEQKKRWQQIKDDFLRNKAMGGDDADTGAKVVAQLVDVAKNLEQLSSVTAQNGSSLTDFIAVMKKENQLELLEQAEEHTKNASETSQVAELMTELLEKVEHALSSKSKSQSNESLLKIAEEINLMTKPIIKKMNRKLAVDLRTYFEIADLAKKSRQLKRPRI